jgi:hypothetical protein
MHMHMAGLRTRLREWLEARDAAKQEAANADREQSPTVERDEPQTPEQGATPPGNANGGGAGAS